MIPAPRHRGVAPPLVAAEDARIQKAWKGASLADLEAAAAKVPPQTLQAASPAFAGAAAALGASMPKAGTEASPYDLLVAVGEALPATPPWASRASAPRPARKDWKDASLADLLPAAEQILLQIRAGASRAFARAVAVPGTPTPRAPSPHASQPWVPTPKALAQQLQQSLPRTRAHWMQPQLEPPQAVQHWSPSFRHWWQSRPTVHSACCPSSRSDAHGVCCHAMGVFCGCPCSRAPQHAGRAPRTNPRWPW